jgi:spermidine synthase
MFSKLLSYFIPINVHRRKSGVSRSLEVSWNNGQLVLDSESTNYSFGSLQRILRIGLQSVSFGRIRDMEHILVLGVAGGSVIRTLTDEINFRGKITGVEIDPDVITLANDYFGLKDIPNFELVTDDAFEYVLKTKLTYDLIIIDIFCDTEMPNFLFETFFTNRIGDLLKPDAYVIFNTMILSPEDNARNLRYLTQWNADRFEVRAIPRLEQHNELFVVKKCQSTTVP